MSRMAVLAQQARELGHVLDVTRRDFDEYDVPPKFYVRCSCGYEARVRRTEKAALETAAFHIGKAVGEAGQLREHLERVRRLNGVSPTR